MVAFGECGFAAEIPAFAGMERGGGRKPESHSRDSENFPRSGILHRSPSANAAVAAEIPAFAGMEGGGRQFSFSELAEETALMKAGASIPKIGGGVL